MKISSFWINTVTELILYLDLFHYFRFSIDVFQHCRWLKLSCLKSTERNFGWCIHNGFTSEMFFDVISDLIVNYGLLKSINGDVEKL